MAGRLLQPRRQTNKKRRDKKGNVHLLSAKRSTAASTFSLMLESLTGKRRMINKRQNIVRDKNSLCIKSSHSFTKQMCFQFHEILPFIFYLMLQSFTNSERLLPQRPDRKIKKLYYLFIFFALLPNDKLLQSVFRPRSDTDPIILTVY